MQSPCDQVVRALSLVLGICNEGAQSTRAQATASHRRCDGMPLAISLPEARPKRKRIEREREKVYREGEKDEDRLLLHFECGLTPTRGVGNGRGSCICARALLPRLPKSRQ